MAGRELNRPRSVLGLPSGGAQREAARPGLDPRAICVCWFGLAAATVLGAGLAIALPTLAPAAHPHATLRPSAGAVASIVLNNLRVLAAPFILVAARFERAHATRLVGDAIVAAILIGNAIAVGLALGRWRGELIPFVPQLPLEYLAAATAAATWVDARRTASRAAPTNVWPNAVGTIALAVAAAVIEVLLTPHAR
jgi:hypothetical protein